MSIECLVSRNRTSSDRFFQLFLHFLPFCRLQEDLLIHGDSVYDIVDKQDHGSVQSEMGRAVGAGGVDDSRLFLCRMNVSRNARRQMRFGDQKVSRKKNHVARRISEQFHKNLKRIPPILSKIPPKFLKKKKTPKNHLKNHPKNRQKIIQILPKFPPNFPPILSQFSPKYLKNFLKNHPKNRQKIIQILSKFPPNFPQFSPNSLQNTSKIFSQIIQK